jgi:hypothetical protein
MNVKHATANSEKDSGQAFQGVAKECRRDACSTRGKTRAGRPRHYLARRDPPTPRLPSSPSLRRDAFLDGTRKKCAILPNEPTVLESGKWG